MTSHYKLTKHPHTGKWEEETYKVVFEGLDVVIFEGGWWMKREDRDRISFGGVKKWRLSKDEKTRQLKTFYIPL